MATNSSSEKNLNKNIDISSSTFHKAICLHDWWLIKAEKEINGKILAVGGLTYREQRAVRVFSSSPIIKRYDLFTLETADGITVMISGSINKSRTEENGFSSEVCNHFLIGFPYYWETYVDQCFSKESTTRGGQKHDHDEKGLLHATNEKTKEVPNKQEKLTPNPGSKEQKKTLQVKSENATQGTPTMRVNAEIVNSSDAESLPSKETLINIGVGGTGPLSNPSKWITRHSSAKDHTVSTSSDAEVVLPSIIDKVVCVKNSSAPKAKLLEGFKKCGITNFCPSVSQDYEADMVVHVEEISRGGVKSSLSNNTEGMDKCVSPSKDGHPKCISKFNKQEDNNVKDGDLTESTHLLGEKNDALKVQPLPIVSSDVNNVTPLNKVVPMNLKTSPKMLGWSKSSKKDNNHNSMSNSPSEVIVRSCTDGTGTNGRSKSTKINNNKTMSSLMSEESAILRSCNDGTDINAFTSDEPVILRSCTDDTDTNVMSKSNKMDNSKTNSSLTSEEPSILRSITDGTDISDSTRDVSASTQTHLTIVYPCDVKLAASVDISIGNLTRVPETQEKVVEDTTSSSTRKRTNLHSVSRSQDYEAVTGIPVEEKLGQGNGFDTVVVMDGVEGALKQSSSTKPDVVSPKVSKRGETFRKPSGQHLIGNGVSSANIPSFRKMDSSKKIKNPSQARRVSIRVKNLKSINKGDKTSNDTIKSERNKTVFVSKDCDMKSNVNDVHSESGRVCDLDQLNIELGEAASEPTKIDVDKPSRNVSQVNSMLSSVSRLSPGALRNASCGSIYDFPEPSKENESCRASMKLDDTNCTSDLKMSLGEEQSNNRKLKQLGRKKENAVPLSRVTRSAKEDQSFVSTESLSLRRSGRHRVPPLDFWRNQLPVYDMEGQLTGVQGGPSHLGSSSGSRSEPPRRKRKLI